MSSSFTLAQDQIHQFLDRRRRTKERDAQHAPVELALHRVLRSLVSIVGATEVAVFLDDPRAKLHAPQQNVLTCIAALGPSAADRVGAVMRCSEGRPGEVYSSGQSVVAVEGAERTVGVPLLLGAATCGALVVRHRTAGGPAPTEVDAIVETFAYFLGCAIEMTIDGARAREAGRRDHLTGLPNESFFHFRLRSELKQSDLERSALGLIVLDLDDFGTVNDHFGYWVGNRTLREVGLLLERLAPPGGLVARIGGDEFALTAPGCKHSDTEALGQRICAEIGRTEFFEEAPSARLSASVGVATFPADLAQVAGGPEHTTALIQLADRAMRLAKARGKRRLAGDPALYPRSP